jgi:hypothetical protein
VPSPALAGHREHLDVVLYTPIWGSDVYRSQVLSTVTRDQLARKLGHQLVQVVQEQPRSILRGVPLEEALRIEEVELHDGIQLAVVVDPVVLPVEERKRSILVGPEIKVEVSAGQVELMSAPNAGDHAA